MTFSINDLPLTQELDRKTMATTVGGSRPPGLLGYEGQPGNQGGGGGLFGNNGPAPGLLGYEGLPGNQGG